MAPVARSGGKSFTIGVPKYEIRISVRQVEDMLNRLQRLERHSLCLDQ
jgi:hypothetical protein